MTHYELLTHDSAMSFFEQMKALRISNEVEDDAERKSGLPEGETGLHCDGKV